VELGAKITNGNSGGAGMNMGKKKEAEKIPAL
jgi:hypothetical protein